MAKRHLNKIFLSASIPTTDRNAKYYVTADIIAIRDAVRALAAVVIPHAHLVWGGHPSITPLIRYVMGKMRNNVRNHVTLYQSNFFKDNFPADNFDFENVILTEEVNNEDESLMFMRRKMFLDNKFKAAVFIGGMEGIKSEFDLFKELHPESLLLPVASTGAASRMLYESYPNAFNERLATDYAYMSLFRDLLLDNIN